MRGNVQTRLNKIENGEFAATLLALAGLKRLGLADKATSILSTEEFLPACGQGAIAITARTDDSANRARLAPDSRRGDGFRAHRRTSLLAFLDGSCRTPIAGHARLEGETLAFQGMVLRKDGSQSFSAQAHGSKHDAARLGETAARDSWPKRRPIFCNFDVSHARSGDKTAT